MTIISKLSSVYHRVVGQFFLNDHAAKNIKDELTRIEERRLKDTKEYWDLYRGDHWTDTEALNSTMPLPTVNKSRKLLDKSVTFLAGKPPIVQYANMDVENILKPLIKILSKNSGGWDLFIFRLLQIGAVSGDAFIKISYDEAKKGVKMEVLNSEEVSVQYLRSNYDNYFPDKVVINWYRLDDTADRLIKCTETWTKFNFKYEEDGSLIEEGYNILEMVPVIHIRNHMAGNDVYGISDLKDLANLNLAYNHQMRQFMEDTKNHSDPVTLLFGARMSSMEKTSETLWSNLPIESRVQNLELDTDFPAQQKFIEYMDKGMYEMGSVPWQNPDKRISNTSGVALHIEHMPSIELSDRKKLFYTPGILEAIKLSLDLWLKLENINRLFATSNQIDNPTKEPYRPLTGPSVLEAKALIEAAISKSADDFEKYIEWNEVSIKWQNYLPKDDLINMQLLKDKLIMGLTSRKRAAKDLGIEDVEELFDEINQDIADGWDYSKMRGNVNSPVPDHTEGASGKSQDSKEKIADEKGE